MLEEVGFYAEDEVVCDLPLLDEERDQLGLEDVVEGGPLGELEADLQGEVGVEQVKTFEVRLDVGDDRIHQLRDKGVVDKLVYGTCHLDVEFETSLCIRAKLFQFECRSRSVVSNGVPGSDHTLTDSVNSHLQFEEFLVLW